MPFTPGRHAVTHMDCPVVNHGPGDDIFVPVNPMSSGMVCSATNWRHHASADEWRRKWEIHQEPGPPGAEYMYTAKKSGEDLWVCQLLMDHGVRRCCACPLPPEAHDGAIQSHNVGLTTSPDRHRAWKFHVRSAKGAGPDEAEYNYNVSPSSICYLLHHRG